MPVFPRVTCFIFRDPPLSYTGMRTVRMAGYYLREQKVVCMILLFPV
jgi:hypothetical protein